MSVPLQLAFSLLLALFALAVAVPLPVGGWSVETDWGTLLSGTFGLGVAIVVLMVAAKAAIQKQLLTSLLVALPAIALAAFSVYHVRALSLDPHQLASLIEIDIEELRANSDVRKELAAASGQSTEEIVSRGDALKSVADDIVPRGFLQPDGAPLQAWLRDLIDNRAGAWPDRLKMLDIKIAAEVSILNDLRDKVIEHAECISDSEPQPGDRRDERGRRIHRNSCGAYPDVGGGKRKAAQANLEAAQQSRLAIAMEIATLEKVVPPIESLQQEYSHSLATGLILLLGLSVVSLSTPGQLRLHWFTLGWMIVLLAGKAKFGVGDPDALPSQISTAALLLAVFVAGRALRLAWRNNRALWQSLKADERGKLLLKAVLLWLPLGGTLCLVLYVPNYFTDRATANLYEVPRPAEIPSSASGLCLPPTDKLVRILVAEQMELARDLDLGIRCLFDGLQVKAGEAVANNQTTNLANNATAVAENAFDAVVPGSLACVIDGGAMSPCIMSWANHKRELDLLLFSIPHPYYIPERLAHNSYVQTRAEYKAMLLQRVKEEFEKAENVGVDAQAVIRSHLDTVIEELALETRRASYKAIVFWRSFDFMGLALLFVSALKSFAYVLGRVTFAVHPRFANRSSESPLRWDQVEVSDVASILLPDDGRHLVRFRASPQNAATGLPHRPLSWRVPPWRRPLFFAAFNRLPADSPTRFSTTGAKRFIVVRLEPGQTVFFRFSALYAASKGLRIGRIWNFGLLNTFHVRLSHITAQGPGLLCLVCDGDPSGRIEVGGTPHFTETHRMLLWASDASFDVKSSAKLCTIYFGSVILSPCEGSVAIFEADQENRPFKGALSFIPALLPI